MNKKYKKVGKCSADYKFYNSYGSKLSSFYGRLGLICFRLVRYFRKKGQYCFFKADISIHLPIK